MPCPSSARCSRSGCRRSSDARRALAPDGLPSLRPLTYSIAIQAIGAFCWPSSWTLNDNPPYRYRLWDWRESEIELCIRDGPRIDPAARALFKKLGF